MVFSSLIFLFFFLPIALIGYYLMPDTKIKNIFLLLLSFLFYAWGEPYFVLLLIFSLFINYRIGLLFDSPRSSKKLIFYFGIVFNIGLLVIFKYSSFIISTINRFLILDLPVPTIPLPLGISFFTFKILTYLIDLYKGKVGVQKSFIVLALYGSFFPQILAGPIEKYTDMEHQINSREHTLSRFRSGVELFTIGLGKKVILAGNLAVISDSIFNVSNAAIDSLSAWIGVISYSMQIYFDFSGYSDMAIGIGKMFGFECGKNFDYPYISKSVGEFWRRWHISLGSFFRDYVYIPLGGSRTTFLKNYRNLFVVWLLTGLWHGSSWSFVIWGLYFGIFIAMERLFISKLLQKIPPFLQHIYLLFVVAIGWVFFRTENLSHALLYLKRLAGFGVPTLLESPFLVLHDNALLLLVSAILCTPIFKNRVPGKKRHHYTLVLESLGLVLVYLLCIMFLGNSSYNPFIYFRF